tara:strand:- start:1225 stop:1386 length:162 start_codon:yes stop_codon:yes gene_type:complete
MICVISSTLEEDIRSLNVHQTSIAKDILVIEKPNVVRDVEFVDALDPLEESRM